ncbi:ABC transporter ATP-binding protein, partial [Streptomyces sp. NPDC048845]
DTVERVLDIVDLRRKAGTRVSQLSGGEKRRLDFATAVYGTPELIFLDEPTTGLDIQSRDALWDAVDKLREEGSTVVLTTHYLEEAQQRADRIGLMHQGTLHREGTVAELTRTLPATVRFTLPVTAPAPPPQAVRQSDGTFLIETFGLQKDLYVLLGWAHDHGVELRELEAGPTRLDDVFRSIGNG